MTWLRHAPRHVHRTVFDHIEAQLASLGWSVEATTPFGAPPVTMIDAPVVDGDQIRKQAKAGTVFVTLGDEPAPSEEELGGPLHSQEFVIFLDVFMDAHSHAVALASDIRDILLGRIGGKRILQVVNQITGDPHPGWVIELDDVERSMPEQKLALHWQVVKVTARVFYPEEVY